MLICLITQRLLFLMALIVEEMAYILSAVTVRIPQVKTGHWQPATPWLYG